MNEPALLNDAPEPVSAPKNPKPVGNPAFQDSLVASELGRLGGFAAKGVSRSNGAPSRYLVLARLRKLDRLMAAAADSKEWDALSRAFERLFKVWQVLANVPGPGQYRPVASRSPGRRRVFELDAQIEDVKPAQVVESPPVTEEKSPD